MRTTGAQGQSTFTVSGDGAKTFARVSAGAAKAAILSRGTRTTASGRLEVKRGLRLLLAQLAHIRYPLRLSGRFRRR